MVSPRRMQLRGRWPQISPAIRRGNPRDVMRKRCLVPPVEILHEPLPSGPEPVEMVTCPWSGSGGVLPCSVWTLTLLCA